MFTTACIRREARTLVKRKIRRTRHENLLGYTLVLFAENQRFRSALLIGALVKTVEFFGIERRRGADGIVVDGSVGAATRADEFAVAILFASQIPVCIGWNGT